ncbi:F-box-like/WD repeat-containing protein TBL1XR1 isoform X1 [Schistocerca gregaria]|uniref:F-box-like/WD repeat-containing protein TBL1XR1 isoform X1 n=1 Tax=Schistocerca gregaria TaxID=7010 RepID=UPI00211EB260|nr:F-box-like/WD repeat-containing protein TBL1XR1 isoform X1 [Schistocerca gregaria]
MSFSSHEVNYLVYRYMKESGFHHSAFTFGYESNIIRADISPEDVANGALINIIQKGMLYSEIEKEIKEDSGHKCDYEPGVLVKSLNKMLTQCGTVTTSSPHPNPASKKKELSNESNVPALSQALSSKYASAAPLNGEKQTAPSSGPEPKPSADSAKSPAVRRWDLAGHQCEVLNCVWHPTESMLATCSSDSTAKIWRPNDSKLAISLLHKRSKNDDSEPTESDNSALEDHGEAKKKFCPKPSITDSFFCHPNIRLTALSWNPVHDWLATASFDGTVYLWDVPKAQLKARFQQHHGPIFVLQWNETGTELLSGGADGFIMSLRCSQDETTKYAYDHLQRHQGPILDISWKNHKVFATADTHGQACIWDTCQTWPKCVLISHSNAINSIRWNATSESPYLLASASDDQKVHLWQYSIKDSSSKKKHKKTQKNTCPEPSTDLLSLPDVAQKPDNASSESSPTAPDDIQTIQPFLTFSEHTKPVYVVRWVPKTAPEDMQTCLVSGGWDGAVKMWDASSEKAKSSWTMTQKEGPIHCLAFSPNGLWLATSTLYQHIYILSIKDGSLFKTLEKNGKILDISWSANGEQLAACGSDNHITIFEIKP